MSRTKTVTHPPREPAAPERNGSRPSTSSYPSRAEAIARWEQLRSVVPVFAQELVSARRQPAAASARPETPPRLCQQAEAGGSNERRQAETRVERWVGHLDVIRAHVRTREERRKPWSP